MKKENKTQYAILGMLSIRPMSGYEIKKSMRESTQYFWSESNGQLYPSLAKLAQNKFIKPKNSSLSDKNKTIYSLSNAGRKVLCSWLLKDVDYYPQRCEWLLKVFFGANMDSKVSINHINNHLKYCENQLKIFNDIAKKLEDLVVKKQRPVYFLLTVNAGIKMMQSEIDWCRESLNLINQHMET